MPLTGGIQQSPFPSYAAFFIKRINNYGPKL